MDLYGVKSTDLGTLCSLTIFFNDVHNLIFL